MLELDQRGENETAFASFCQAEADRQQTLFLRGGFYQQVKKQVLTPTLTVEVQVYQGMKGQGFVIFAYEFREDGTWWTRRVGIGPEHRDLEWTPMKKQAKD